MNKKQINLNRKLVNLNKKNLHKKKKKMYKLMQIFLFEIIKTRSQPFVQYCSLEQKKNCLFKMQYLDYRSQNL